MWPAAAIPHGAPLPMSFSSPAPLPAWGHMETASSSSLVAKQGTTGAVQAQASGHCPCEDTPFVPTPVASSPRAASRHQEHCESFPGLHVKEHLTRQQVFLSLPSLAPGNARLHRERTRMRTRMSPDTLYTALEVMVTK